MRPYVLVSLMELLELNAEAFCRLSSVIGQMLIVIDTGQSLNISQVAGTLGELQREAKKLEIRSVDQQLERIKEHFESGSVTRDSVKSMIANLYERMRDDFRERTFLAVPVEMETNYRQPEPLFGPDVERKVPRASEDISEAGKCLALNRSTASVFHLMRVMEIAVQEFGEKLGISLASEKMWQPILNKINDAIRELDPKDPITKSYAGASAHLYSVKIAWRNEVMHPKMTYTFEEARAIFDSTRVFMKDLSGLL